MSNEMSHDAKPNEVAERIVQCARRFSGEDVENGRVAVAGILSAPDCRPQVGVRYLKQGMSAMKAVDLDQGARFEPAATIPWLRTVLSYGMSDQDSGILILNKVYRDDRVLNLYDPFQAPSMLCGADIG